jgi:hypothetical protein
LSRIFIVHDVRGERRLGEADLPLTLGGTASGDIVLPDFPADAVIAYIALAEGHLYIQPVTDAAVQLFHNHEFLTGSTWLKSGDEVLQTFVTERHRIVSTSIEISPTYIGFGESVISAIML